MRKSTWALILFFLLLYILPLGGRPLLVPDETRYGEIPREMIVSGDFIVPRLGGVRYFEKPVLGYWLTAASIELFGQNAFALRLPSALSAVLSALMLFLLVRRMTGWTCGALMTAGIFLTSFEVLVLGQAAILDGPLAFFLTAGLVAFAYAHTEESPGRRWIYMALFGVAVGLAFLTKGFLALALPVMIIVPFMIWEGRWKDLFRISWTPLAAALIVALPWSIAIHLREPDFWKYFFFVEHIHRFMGETAQHAEPFWFFLPVLLAGGLPWSIFFPIMATGLRSGWNGPHVKLLKYALCWFLFPFIFFSMAKGKLGTYILPCFPGLAILAAFGWHYYIDQKKDSALRKSTIVLAAIPIFIAVGLFVVSVTDILDPKLYDVGGLPKLLAVIGGSLAWAVLTLAMLKKTDHRNRLIGIGLAPALFIILLGFCLPDLTLAAKAPGGLFQKYGERIKPGDEIYADGEMVASVCWFLKTTDVYVLNTPNEFAYGTSYADSSHKMAALDDFRAKVREKKAGERFFLFITRKAYTNWKKAWPDLVPEQTFQDGGFILAMF